MINFKTIWEGLKIKAKAVLTSDEVGEIEVSSVDNKTYLHNGSTRSPIVTEAHTATLTNKTIDANGTGNSISNLETADLAAGVLNTSTTLAAASNTQVPSALAVKTYIDDGLAHQNEASEITYDNSVSGLAATNAQDAIDEVEARVDTAESDITAVENALQAHITNPSDAHDASAISNDPSGNLAATTVQAALNELQTDIDTRATQSDLANHINQVTDAHDASAISVSPTVDLVSTTVQAALEELQAEVIAASGSASGVQANLDAHINDTVDAHDASAISVVPTGNLAATEVQAALVELQSDIDTRATSASLSAHTSASTGVHGVTGSVVGTSDTQTLTNKTIDADLNTITNIENADIKAGAAIDRSKLASGTANKVLVNDGSGVMSEMANVTDSANALILSNLKHIELQSIDDSTSTGADATIATFSAGGVRITNGSLTSLANIPAGNNGQQFVLFNRTGVSVSIKDASAAIGSAASRILTGTGADITLAANAALILSYDGVSNRWQVVGGSGGGSGSATSAVDNVFTINDATDATKQINFDAGGTTATKTTIAASQTANRVLSLPDVTDTLVSRTSTDTLTNKTIVAANNTITTAASGNLTSTELNAALSELQQHIDSIDPNANELLTQNFETAVLADFTQTGLELVSSPFIHGTKTARLIHQAASTRSFKQTKSVDPKFRGKNLTLRLDGRSSAASANVTVLVTDETNAATLVSSTFTTGQITAAVFNTASASPTITVTDNSVLNSISIGASITGSGIPTGTTVTAKSTSTITISQNASATATGVALKVSALPNIQSYSFDVPSNCASISYTISALQEAGLPETYVDDVVVELTSMVLQNTSVTVPKNNDTNWTSYTPVFTGFTSTTNSFRWKREGDSLLIEAGLKLTSVSAVAASFTLPSGLVIDVLKQGEVNAGVAAVGEWNSSTSAAGIGLYNAVSSGLVFTESGNLDKVYFSLQNNTDTSNNVVLGKANGSTLWNPTGNVYIRQIRIPIQGWSANETETKTIPLTSSIIQTQSDSYLRITGFASNINGSSATKIASIASGTIQQNLGSGLQYIDDSINGARFVAQQEGLFRFNFSTDAGTSGQGAGFSLNSVNLTTDFASLPASEKIAIAYDAGAAGITSVFGEAYLKIGDVVRIHRTGTQPSSDPSYSTFTASCIGSAKILNPSSDQKVEIPTHELRFEGASARGSVATAIVKFDTLAKIKGDGFEVINTAADGTYVRIKKSGRLNVSSSLLLSDSNAFISLNQTVLTGFPTVSSEILSSSSNAANRVKTLFAPVDVKIGDIIRVGAGAAPSVDTGNNFTLSLMETSVAVALQNVAPRWDDSDSAVRLNTANGYGSVATRIRRFSNLNDNFGSSIEYTDSPTEGARFSIKEDGEYQISYTESATSISTFGISLNSNNLAVNAGTLLNNANNEILAAATVPTASYIQTVSWQGFLRKGDIIRPHTDAIGISNPSNTKFSINKIGKTQGTVDVTPFVQIPQNEVEAIEALTTTSTFGSTNTGVPVLNITKNTNKGIIQVLSSAAEGTSFKVLKDCELQISVAFQSSVANGSTGFITKNSTALTAAAPNGIVFQTVSASISVNNMSTNIIVSAGDVIRFQRDSTNLNNVNFVTITATAISPSIATPTEQVSSDTIPFVFKATAITDSDPVGTFNTYTYAANTNTATISATAPTQSTSSMNINGVQVFARAYNATSTAAQPARVDIKIGKGIKSKEVLAYAAVNKATPINIDLLNKGTFVELYGTEIRYSEATGILSINAAEAGSAVTLRLVGMSDGYTGQSSGYFTFNASKSPSLVSIPNLQQRVAYLSDVKPNNTAGGASGTTTTQTRTLNTIVDSTGIVVSLASNQFTLSAGTYRINASVPGYTVGGHKARLRNVTDGTTTLIGTSEYSNASADNADSRSMINGEFTITSNKAFEIQHYTNAVASSGLGRPVNSGESEVYTQVEITKIK